jgi:hypothetical protein
MPGSGWRKSSHSSADGDCVETASLGGFVGVRDTKDRGGPVLAVTAATWRLFACAVKGGLLIR